MRPALSPLFLIAWLGIAGSSWAQTYNFEYLAGGSILSSQSGWISTDTNQADGVEAEQSLFFPGTSGTKVGILGGYWTDGPSGPLITPSSRTSLLSANVTASPDSSNPLLRFRWLQNISNTDQDNGRRDSFGWAVRSGSTSLLSLISEPNSPGSSSMTVRGYAGDPVGSFLGSSFTPNVATTARGSAYAFEILLNPVTWTWSAKISGSFATDYEAITNWSTIIQNAALGGTQGSTVDGFAAIWTTQDSDPANAGRNVMAFDNIQINSVPEPTTLSLITFGSLALLALRRRS